MDVGTSLNPAIDIGQVSESLTNFTTFKILALKLSR